MALSDDDIQREEVTATKLRLTLGADVYEIERHTGMSAYTTGLLVKKLLLPVQKEAELVFSNAYARMTEAKRKEYDALVEENKKEEDKDKRKANQEKMGELMAIPIEEYYDAETKGWELIDPSEHEKLMRKLFQNVVAQGVGNLGNHDNFDRHFSAAKPERFEHIDILKSEVISWNNFLDSARSPLRV